MHSMLLIATLKYFLALNEYRLFPYLSKPLIFLFLNGRKTHLSTQYDSKLFFNLTLDPKLKLNCKYILNYNVK